MPRSLRDELIAIQKKLWRWNKDLIDHSVLVKEPGFDAYEQNYKRAVHDYARASNQDEMIEAVLQSNVIFVGDYHTCNQSQRSFLRILKEVVRHDPSVMVGLELLHKKSQSSLDEYMDGAISEKTFLRRIKLEEHWVFDLWENFKPIFDFCRYHGTELFAIDAARVGSNVRTRDRKSAHLIADILEEHPGRRLFVFIGDLHLAPKHLPRDVAMELKRRNLPFHPLILFQNSENIYWKLAEAGVEDWIEVVKLRDGNFCRMHTPPVVEQRSYLNWLEHEEGEIDYADAKSSFLEIVERLCEFLGIRLGRERDDVEIFTCGDLSFLRQLRDRGDFSKDEIDIIKRQILASESYYIAQTKFVYLANLSINHAAEEASHFIKSVCSGPEEPRFVVDAFYANCLHEALGFFGSKVINHKRKCFHERDFKSLLSYFQTVRIPEERRLEYETAHLVMEYKKLERSGKALSRTEIFRSRMDLFLSVTHAIGYMLGDRLYYGLMSGVIKKPLLKQLFCDPWAEEGDPVEVYMNLWQKLRKVKLPRRM